MEFESMDDLREFVDAAPSPDLVSDSLVAEWLAGGGMSMDGRSVAKDGPATAVVVVVRDEGMYAETYPVPTSELDDSLRAALASLSGSAFAEWFTSELEEDDWRGAFWLLGLLSRDPNYLEEHAEIVEEAAEEEVELGADGLAGRIGAWTQYEVTDSAGLSRPIEQCYVVRIAY